MATSPRSAGRLRRESPTQRANLMSVEADAQRFNPDPVVKFDGKRVRDVLHDALKKKYEGWSYDALTANSKAKEVTRFVLNSLSDKDRKVDKDQPTFFQMGRYKCIFQMYCVQLAGQGLRLATRELWNQNTDNLISETFQGKDFAAVGLFWYVYIE